MSNLHRHSYYISMAAGSPVSLSLPYSTKTDIHRRTSSPCPPLLLSTLTLSLHCSTEATRKARLHVLPHRKQSALRPIESLIGK